MGVLEELGEITIEEVIDREGEVFDDLDGALEDIFDRVGDKIEDKLTETLGGVVEFNNDVSGVLASAGLDIISPTIGNISRGVFGKNQFGSFVGNTATNLAGNFLQNGLSKVFGGGPKTTVSSRETQRSTDAVSQMRLSRSQQSALMLQELERGRRNL